MKKEYIVSKKSNCNNCYKCIRHCPVNSIRFSSGQASVIPEECILCGECYAVCPKAAKAVREDLEIAKAILAEDIPVYASIAPSFVAAFEGVSFSTLQEALLKLGFTGVEETAVGATVVKNEYQRILRETRPKVLISSHCPSMNALIQKYYPAALPYLANVQSPMQVHSRMIKRIHPEAKVIYVGSCIAEKAEGDLYPGFIDCVITFRELARWLGEARINLIPSEEPKGEHSRTRMFPTTGGVLHSMTERLPDYHYLAIDGVENCKDAITDVLNGKLSNCFIEMTACDGSCINSPIISKARQTRVRSYLALSKRAGDKDFEVVMPESSSLIKAFAPNEQHRNMPSKEEIQEILAKMGKTLPEHHLNCGTCGYDTCREKAIAVYQGKADLNMCLPFLKDKAESFSDNIINNTPNGIIVINENLEILQINNAARRIMNLQYDWNVIGDQLIRILDPTPFFEVIDSGRNIHAQRLYLAEYRKYVEQTIIHDKGFHVLMCIMRDVTSEEYAREARETISRQTIDITDKVIEKQMRVVQEIASLLGETTAETKVALTNLKESLRNDQ